jgi:hypothetical protein
LAVFNGPITASHTPASISATGSISASAVHIGGANGPVWSTGTGNPNGSIVGSVGDMFTRTDGGAGSTLYVKESGADTSAGWVAK